MKFRGELVRKTIHLSSLALPVALYLVPPATSRVWLCLLALVTLLVDAIRLHEPHVRRVFYFLFGALLREHERFNLLGSTYLLMACLLCISAFEQPIAVTVLAFLVVGDTAAALVGRRFGRTKILDKSVEGSAACFLSCVAVGLLYPGPEITAPMVLVGALVATLFELLPVPLDDNLRIPLSAGFAMEYISLAFHHAGMQ